MILTRFKILFKIAAVCGLTANFVALLSVPALARVRAVGAANGLVHSSEMSCSASLEQIWAQEDFIRDFGQMNAQIRRYLDLKRENKIQDAGIERVTVLSGEGRYAQKKVYVVKFRDRLHPIWFSEERSPLYYKRKVCGEFGNHGEVLEKLLGPVLVGEQERVRYEFERKTDYRLIDAKIRKVRNEYQNFVEWLETQDGPTGQTRNFVKYFGAYLLRLAETDASFDLTLISQLKFIPTETPTLSGVPYYVLKHQSGRLAYVFGYEKNAPVVYREPVRAEPLAKVGEAFTFANGQHFEAGVVQPGALRLTDGSLVFFSKGSKGLQLDLLSTSLVNNIKKNLIEKDFASDHFEGGDYSYFVTNYFDDFVVNHGFSAEVANLLNKVSVIERGHAADDVNKEFLLIDFGYLALILYKDHQGETRLVRMFYFQGSLSPSGDLFNGNVNSNDVLDRSHLKKLYGLKTVIDARASGFRSFLDFLKEFRYQFVLSSGRVLKFRDGHLNNKITYAVSDLTPRPPQNQDGEVK